MRPSLYTAGWIVLLLFLALYVADFAGDIRMRDSFSWMDPAQYYEAAAALARGTAPAAGFDVPTLFPVFIADAMGGDLSVPAALRVNILFAALLAGAALLLRRELGIACHPLFVLAPILSSPLLIGLSRELYIEFALSALVALAYFFWLRARSFRRGAPAVLFALLFACGLLMKMTWPLYFAGPLLFEAVRIAGDKRWRSLLYLGLSVAVPVFLVLAGVRIAFEHSFGYYLALGNTKIPIMRLIGPARVFSIASFTYYPIQFARVALGWVTILLALPLAGAFRTRGEGRAGRPGDRAILWLWLLAPMAILTFQAVKEPRHLAPCVLPALLLILAAIERIDRPPVRKVLLAVLLLVSFAQYFAVTRGIREAPYYFDSPTGLDKIEKEMIGASPERERFRSPSGKFGVIPWRYTLSVALSGFEDDEALAAAWHFAPGVTYDLDLDQWRTAGGEDRAYSRFEDLFYFSALNIYNARCNWRRMNYSLGRDDVLALADFLLVKEKAGDGTGSPHPGFREVSRVGLPDGSSVRVLAPEEPPGESYRQAYAAEFLRRAEELDAREWNTIYYSLFMEERVRGRLPERNDLIRGFPVGYAPGPERRNIYWIAHYGPLAETVGPSWRDHVGD